jgi:protocatechuate 3,4-dioxygenase beta subunit
VKAFKTVLFYILMAALLIMITMLTGTQYDPSDVSGVVITTPPPPTITATPTLPRPTRMVVTAGPNGCITTPFGGYEGYQSHAPFTTHLAPADAKGDLLTVSGTVHASDCKTPLRGVILEVWQADSNGNYDSNTLRGRVSTDLNGRYKFVTLKPKPSVRAFRYRPAHIHFRVRYPGMQPIKTQLFFEGDRFFKLHYDSPAVRRLTRPITTEGSMLKSTFDIVLSVDPPQPRPNDRTWRIEEATPAGS